MAVRLALGFLLASLIGVPAGVSPALGNEEGSEPAPTASREVKRLPEGADPAAGHLEVPDDRYVPVPRTGRATSPGGRQVRDGYVSVQVNVDAAGANIIGDAANEPSIAVDRNNRHRMAIGWRQFDTITNNFRQAGWGYTDNGGRTWSFPGVIEPGVFRSDPVLCANTQGVFFYNSLTATEGLTEFWCNVYESVDGGASWDSGVYAYGGDKQWMAADLTNGIGQDNLYAYWTKWYTCPGCDGHFTRSYDGGQTFLTTTDVPGNPQWGTLAVGPDGELYVAGDGFTVAKSTTMQDGSLPVQWDFSTTVDLDGSMGFSGGPNPGGLLGQVWIAVDHSDGPNRGNVYLLCSVNRSSTPDPMDVMFARSTDGGSTWSAPVRVNDDPTDSAYQWFGTMSVAPNGRIDAVWADTRNDLGGYDSEIYYSYSEDTGLTWSVNEALTPSFDPHVGWPQQNKMGDYFDMVSDNLGADLAYAATFNGEQDVYHLRIGPACLDAGTVELDSPKYACEGSATITVNDCGLNTDDEAIETVQVTVDSASEPTGEAVLLTETDVATALFEGSLTVSETDGVGVLLISEGETVTATYVDADDGEGGTNVTVTDVAVIDCTPPMISFVQTADIGPFSASVTFQTDESALGAVRFGTSCGDLAETAARAGYRMGHAVTLTGLDDNTVYYYAVDAEDEAGNPASDDNAGGCYTFATEEIPLYYTELFDSSDNDLAYRSLFFTPNASVDFYAACVEDISELPTSPTGGTTLSLSEDGYEQVSLSGGDTVSLFGSSYSAFYAGSNGYITFTSGDGEWTESFANHFDRPRVSVLYDDFSPQNGGPVTWMQLADRAVVTWEDVPEYNTSNSNTFQVEMYFDGRIVLSYLSLAANDGLVGLSEGGGVPPEFYETDLSDLGDCYTDCNGNGVNDSEDIASGTSFDANGNAVPDECEVVPPTAGGGFRTNRYVAINPQNEGIRTGFQVTMIDGPGDPGIVGWLDKPLEWGCPEACSGQYVSRVVDGPLYRVWTEDLVYVSDCEIVPAATYEVRTSGDGMMFSDPLQVATIVRPAPAWWGDCVGQVEGEAWTAPDGVVNFNDVTAAVQYFMSAATAPHLTVVDVDPEVPNQVLNFSDIMLIVLAFQGDPYPNLAPSNCP